MLNTTTKLNRRSFLSVAAAALVMDPDRLLWVPGAKVYSIPKPKPVAPNTFNARLAMHPIVRVMTVTIDGTEIEFNCDRLISLGPGDIIRVSFRTDDLARLEITEAQTARVRSINMYYGEE